MIFKRIKRDSTQISPEMELYFFILFIGSALGINAPILVEKVVESSNTIYVNDTTADERKIYKKTLSIRHEIIIFKLYAIIKTFFLRG